MRTECLDCETRGAVSLHDYGAYTYAMHPSTEPLSLCFATDDAEPLHWLPAYPVVPAIFMEIAAVPDDWQVVAHNAEFDRAIYEHVLVPRYGFPALPARIWRCTQRLALANAYPAELDLLAQALGLPYRKDPAARKAMLDVCRPKQQRKRKATTIPAWDKDPTKLALLYERNKLDVITTRAVWQSHKLQHPNETEHHGLIYDASINERGIRLDRAFTMAARDFAIAERTAINLKLQELTHGAITSVDQSKRFLETINAHGHNMTTMNKRAVAQVLAGKPDGFVRKLLELRQDGARAAVNKFKRMLIFASPTDDRMRGTLRMYGSATGRWSGLGPQLQNLKKNESGLPLSVVDSIRAGDRTNIAQYGNPLALLGDVSRAALCAGDGMELKSGDFSAVESVVLAWLAGEHWKLIAYRTFQATGDLQLEPYRVIARRMLHKAEDAEISPAERQLGKGGELAAGFGGSVGAWRRIVPHDTRSDNEIEAIIKQWRGAHPATTRFWKDLARAIRITIRTGQPILVAEPPRPSIVTAFADGNLTLTLPSGRAITYPEARLVPNRKFEDGDPDVQFMDNARGQWKPTRGWFGTFVENVVQGTARDLLAAAIERCESRGLPVVFHCHDEVTVEVPIGSLSDAEFLEILLHLPLWAAGLPLGGKVHSGPHYLEAPEHPAEPLAVLDPDAAVVEQAVDAFIDTTRDDLGEIDDPALMEREDDADYVANLADNVAPLTELVSLPLSSGNKVSCPFHEDPEPSCTLYADHFHCYGCGAHGSRLDWLTQVEGMTEAEAISYIKDWGPSPSTLQSGEDDAKRLAFIMSIWNAARSLLGSIAERYLDEVRDIDITKLPADLHNSLRFHPDCVFGSEHHACLIALMRDPLTDEPVGIQRIALTVERDGTIAKIGRRMLGHAGVVKLWPASSNLVVGEGLETVLAAATRITDENGELLIPAWATLSSGKLAALPLIPGVERLILLIDNDANQQGQTAAAHVAAVWRAAGHIVVPLMPRTPDTDFNDLILGRVSHAAL